MGKTHIGIVSAEHHAKGLAKMLSNRGYKFTVLGFDPDSIPASYKVIVCRVKSCSHGAYALAITAQRQGRDVIFENGSNRVIEALKQIEKGTFVSVAPSNVEGGKDAPNASKKAKPKKTGRPQAPARQAIEVLIKTGGFFFFRLWKKMDRDEAINFYRNFSDLDQEAGDSLKKAAETLWDSKITDSSVKQATNRAREQRETQSLWMISAQGRPIQNLLAVRELLTQEQLLRIAARLGMYLTREDALASKRKVRTVNAPKGQINQAPKGQDKAAGKLMKQMLDPAGDICAKDTLKAEAKPKTVKSDAEELDEMLFFLREQLDKMGLQKAEGHGIAVAIQTVHLTGPEGFVCGKRGVAGVGSRKPGEVSCKKCLNTKAYALATFWADNAS